MYRIYVRLGTIAHRISLPLLRVFLRRTSRAYVLLIADGSALLVKNWLSDGRWALPGGGLHRGESPQAAAIRECTEEVGFAPGTAALQLVHQGIWQTDRLGFQFRIYRADVAATPPKINGFEVATARWVALEDITSDSTPAEIIQAIKKVLA